MCFSPLLIFLFIEKMSAGHHLQFPLVAKTTSGHQSHFLTHGLTWHCVSDAFAIYFNVWWLFVLRWLSLHICVCNCDLRDSSWVPCCGEHWITEWTQLPIACMLDMTLEISNNFQINNELIITLIYFSALQYNTSIWILLWTWKAASSSVFCLSSLVTLLVYSCSLIPPELIQGATCC